jgi:type I restriction enzyme, S subunit
VRFSPYGSYKKSAGLGLEMIPSHWLERRLKFVALTQTSNVDKNSKDDEIPVKLCNYVDVYKNERITSSIEFMNATATAAEVGKFAVKRGDVLITKDSETWADIAVPAIVAEELPGVICGYHLAMVRSQPGVFNEDYLFRLFCSEALNYQFKISANGVTRFGLAASAIKDAAVLCPPIDEQIAIAKFVDYETAKIDATINSKRRLNQLLEEERLSIITHAVTKGINPTARMTKSSLGWPPEMPRHWQVVQLGKKIELHRGFDITKVQQVSGPYPVVSSGGVDSYNNAFMCKGPGVLIGRKGAAGKLHYIDGDFWPHDTTLYVRRFNGNNRKFVFYKLMSMDLINFDTGSSNPTINRNVVHPTKVGWPPIEEQDAIVEYLEVKEERINKLQGRLQDAVRILKEYRSSLITNAVTGKIDVRSGARQEAAE